MHLYLCRDGVSCRLFIWRPPYTLKHGFSRYLTLQQQKSEVVTSKLYAGADPGFQVRGGAHLKNLRRAEGGAKFVLVFRVKNHDFTQKNHIFSNCGGKLEIFWGISCEKSRFLRKQIIFFPILGGGGPPGAPPPLLDPPLVCICLLANNPKHTVH